MKFAMASNNDEIKTCILHNDANSRGYTDRCFGPVDDVTLLEKPNISHLRARSSRTLLSRPISFPCLLHDLLNDAEVDGFTEVVSWQVHGRAFQVYDKNRFASEIMPRYFKAKCYGSFQRQLYMYNFSLVGGCGRDARAFYHEYCLRGRLDLAGRIIRRTSSGFKNSGYLGVVTVTASAVVTAGKSSRAPDFYSLPACEGPALSAHETLKTAPSYSPSAPSSVSPLWGERRDDTIVNGNRKYSNRNLLQLEAAAVFIDHKGTTTSRSSFHPVYVALFAQMKKFSFENKCVAEVGDARDNGTFQL